jgi:hypothetical protein
MTVFKFISLISVSVLCFTLSYGHGMSEKSSTVAQMRQAIQQINEYKKYKVVTIDDPEVFLGHSTDNGDSLQGYYKSDSLKKIVEWVGLSNRVVQNEFYFAKGKLVFVYSTDKQYKFNRKSGEMDYSKFDKVFTSRYYYSNDKLLQTIIGDKEHQKTRLQDAADFLSSSKHYTELLKVKRK